MSLNVGKVWLKKGEQEILVESNAIISGDVVVIHMGNVIPFDGTVVSGEGVPYTLAGTAIVWLF